MPAVRPQHANTPRTWPPPSPTALAAPAGLRRRQDAARRLPPLHDGRRDPIARTPARPQTLLQVQVGKRTCWYLGITRAQAKALFKRAGVTRHMHDGRGWCTPIEDADDVLTVAEHALRWHVAVEAVDR
ncbi:hypothetical protein DQ244_01585 [Blastococcus sp. TBT05-19]|nr:hypothetical protein DQ244_01585 [Blastococcus sp. TBT05-19]